MEKVMESVISTERMGEIAGRIWRQLRSGPTSLNALVRSIGMSEAEIWQGIGWLAREGKLQVNTGEGKYALVEREMAVKS